MPSLRERGKVILWGYLKFSKPYMPYSLSLTLVLMMIRLKGPTMLLVHLERLSYSISIIHSSTLRS